MRRSPRTRRIAQLAALAAQVLALAGCGTDGPTPPDDAGGDVPVRLCTEADWFAYRNEGGQWTRLVPQDGEMRFDATERVTFALANAEGAAQVHVYHVTASQLVSVFGCDRDKPPTSVPAARIGGVVRGLVPGAQAQLAYGRYGRFVTASDTTYTMPVEGGSRDFVAAHVRNDAPFGRADRLILRRAQTYPAGTDLPLDFSSAEAFVPEERALRVDGGLAGVLVELWTATTRPFIGGVMLQGTSIGGQVGDGASRTLPLSLLPASRLVAGDMHRVLLDDMAGRRLEAYLHAPRDLSLSLGPPAAMPTVSTDATTPYRRLRAVIPVQPEYDRGVSIFFHPFSGTGGSVSINATREHFGATPPATWTLAVPDLTGVPGFEARFGLPTTGQLRWSLRVTGRPDGELVPLVPTDGLVFRSAAREGAVP